MKLSNPFKSFSPPHTFFKSLHQRDVLLSKPLYANPRHPRYLESNKSHHKFLLPSSKLLLHFPSNASLKSLMSFTPQPPMILRTTYLVPTHSNNFPPILLTTLKEIPLDGDQLMCDNMRSFKKNKRKRLIEKRGPRY